MRLQEEIIADLERILDEKLEVYIFGAGKIGTGIGRELLRLLNIPVNGYCDTNPQKWQLEIEQEVFCISPQEVLPRKKKACFVMLGQYHKASGLQVVETLGFDIIINYDELCSLDMLIDKFMMQCDESSNMQEIFDKKRKFLEMHEDEGGYKVPNLEKKKIAVYTCIAGGYDDVIEPEVISNECDYYLISDNRPENLNVFQWLDINKVVPDWVEDSRRQNRYCKIKVEKIFSEYQFSIYIDGNVKIVHDISNYIDRIGKSGFATHLHAYNNCLYVEAIKVIAAKVEDERIVKAQVKQYRKEGMPRDFGQFQNAILVRENNNPICKKLMADWWREVFVKSYRDQLSLTYCLWKNNIDKNDIGILGNDMRGNSDFVWVKRHHI